ncbi:ScbR family autoregulator-binding transcription factor [Streptomyces sp. TP-A0356]|uniref:ScbR family autoregulator-binding transcription factor n=1 Tax=Streptomyces sp. TP-A0356 TaxID=1359208 RepID=UPI0006E40D8D|nr:ScbR family autoregulator-binding transcription factor [Streptomyces sp. TP-A0356]
MARQERALRTRQKLLEAAAKVISARGYRAATIAEILKAADITKGALYFHFDSKQALADAIIKEQTLPYAPVEPPSPLQRLIDMSLEIGRGLQTDPLLMAGTRIAVDTLFDESPVTPFQDWTGVAVSLLTEARRAGEVLPHVEPSECAELIIAAYTGVQLFSQAASGRKDLTERIVTLWKHLLPSIANPAAIAHLDFDKVPAQLD